MIALFLITVNVVTGLPQCDCETDLDCSSGESCVGQGSARGRCQQYITQDVVYWGICERNCEDRGGTCYDPSCPPDWDSVSGYCTGWGELCCIYHPIPDPCTGTPGFFDCSTCNNNNGACGTCCNEVFDHTEYTICGCWPADLGGCRGNDVEAPDSECGDCGGDICCCRETLVYSYETKACNDVVELPL